MISGWNDVRKSQFKETVQIFAALHSSIYSHKHEHVLNVIYAHIEFHSMYFLPILILDTDNIFL